MHGVIVSQTFAWNMAEHTQMLRPKVDTFRLFPLNQMVKNDPSMSSLQKMACNIVHLTVLGLFVVPKRREVVIHFI